MNYRAGYFQTMRDIADRDHHVVLFLGDYLYKYPIVPLTNGRPLPPGLPPGLPPELATYTLTLDDYRLRHALYRTDTDLQAAHRHTPWIVTWDDHEVSNDDESDATADLVRRAAAYRAYWENMPLRGPQRPQGSDARLYRRFSWGGLAQLDIADTRQYRDPETVLSPAPDEGERPIPSAPCSASSRRPGSPRVSAGSGCGGTSWPSRSCSPG